MNALPSGRIKLLALLAIVTAACGDDGSGPEGLCIGVVNVGGVLYAESSDTPVPPETVSAEAFLTVSRNTGCLDQGQTSEPLAHGESNFLDAGTTLHVIEGVDPDERLAVYYEVIGEWGTLQPLTSSMSGSR